MRPRVLLLADVRNWAFDFVARSMKSCLSQRYKIEVVYTEDSPKVDPERLDLLYVFFWADDYHHRFQIPKAKVIREVASFRWQTEAQFGHLAPKDFADRYLDDCLVVTTPARCLRDALAPTGKEVFVCPNGFEPALFHPKQPRKGPLKVGWVGRPTDDTKGLWDILVPATRGKWEFRYTDGRWSRGRVAKFYRELDVIAIASIAESQPLPLIEGMASGCFPVSCHVGIVPQLVVNRANGLIVERSVAAFQAAFEWCSENLDVIRRVGWQNAAMMRRTRTWEACAARFDEIFTYTLALQRERHEPRSVSKPAAEAARKGSQAPQTECDHSSLNIVSSGKSLWAKKWLILLGDRRVAFIGTIRRFILLCSLREIAGRVLPESWFRRLKRVREAFLR